MVSKNKILKNIGIVLICYLTGMIVGNLGILPEGFSDIQVVMQDVSVVLALPLLLFSLNVKLWFKIAKSGLLAMLLAVISIVVTVFILHFTVGAGMQDNWKMAGMASAIYTGGTPNLAAMKTALQVDNNVFIIFHTYDTVFSLLYIFFMCSLARAFFQKVFRLRKYAATDIESNMDGSEISDESIETYSKLLKPSIIPGLLLALLLSAVFLGLAFLLSGLFAKDTQTSIIILTITTLGIAASFVKPVRKIKYTFQLGMYIIYVFCFTVASITNFRVLINIDWDLLIYVGVAIFGSLLIHALLCKLCKIDADIFIITSVSAICSPPFVPVVSGALKNKNILISGLVTGIIGYAIGNYLGITIASLFRALF